MTFDQLNPSLQKLIKENFPEASDEQINSILAMAEKEGMSSIQDLEGLISALVHEKQQHGSKTAALQSMSGPRRK